MEPTSLEAHDFGDKQDLEQNVSSPFSHLNPKESKFTTEEFLRRETNVSPNKLVKSNEESNLNSNNVENTELDTERTNVIQGTDNSADSDTCPKTHTIELPNDQITDNVTNSSKHGDQSTEDKLLDSDACLSSSEHDNKLSADDEFKASEVIHSKNENDQTNDSEEKFKASEVPVLSGEEVPGPSSLVSGMEGEVEADDVKEDGVEETEEPKEEWLDILGSGHLLKKVIKPGEPDSRPNKSDICTISFTGRLEDGTVVEEVENLQIHLNDNEVIQGIDFALALMEKGEEAELKVGPRFAYGSLGRQPNIPAGATLFYSVKLLDVQEDPPMHALSIKDRISLGLKKKERGNFWYARDEHSIAITCYRRALEFFDDTDIAEPDSQEDMTKLLDERLKTYNNLTASQMKIHAYDAALMSVNHVLTSQPKNVKALFRKSKILKEKGDLSEAIKAVRLALSIDKESKSLQQELSSLLAAQRKDNTKQRELYKKMMGTSANQDKEDASNTSRNSYSAIKWSSIFAFAAVLVAGTFALKYKM